MNSIPPKGGFGKLTPPTTWCNVMYPSFVDYVYVPYSDVTLFHQSVCGSWGCVFWETPSKIWVKRPTEQAQSQEADQRGSLITRYVFSLVNKFPLDYFRSSWVEVKFMVVCFMWALLVTNAAFLLEFLCSVYQQEIFGVIWAILHQELLLCIFIIFHHHHLWRWTHIILKISWSS